MSYRHSSTVAFMTPAPIPAGAEHFAWRCAMGHALRFAGNKAAASSGPDNRHGRSQRAAATTQATPATTQHIAIIASDQAAKQQSP